MSTFDDASLVLIPSGYKASKVYSVKPTDGTGDLTFTRSLDTATRVGADGLIEKVRTNVITYSQDLSNAIWVKISMPVTANAGISPDGTNTADKIVPTSSNTSHLIYYDSGTSVSGEYSLSLFVKASGFSKVALRESFTSGIYASFNLTTGTVIDSTAGLTNTITSVGNGWFRISFTASGVLSVNLGVIALPNSYTGGDPFAAFAGDDVSGILVWGAQVERGVRTPYIPTTTAAVSVGMLANVPRLDYLGGGCPKLLLEPQRTNLVTFSEQIDNADWGKINATIAANNTTSPDGYVNADKYTKSVAGTSVLFQANKSSATANTFSIFAKNDAVSSIRVGMSDNGTATDFEAIVNLANGTIISTTAGATSKIENYGNGWYRISVTRTSIGNVNPYFGIPNSVTGSFFAYGCGLEVGSYPTSYIPTLGAAVTRSADAASKTASLFNQTNFSIFFDYKAINGEGGSAPIFGLTETAGNNLEFYVNNENGLNVYANLGGGYLFGTSANAGFTIGSQSKVLVTYNGTTLKYFINGVLYGSGASSLPFTSRTLFFTSNKVTLTSQMLFFPITLTDTQAIQLTA